MSWKMVLNADVSVSLLLFVAVFVLIYMVLNWFSPKLSAPGKRLPPAMPSLPLVGSLPFLLGKRNLHEFFMKTAQRIGNVFLFYAGSSYIVILNGKATIREALIKNGDKFAGRFPVYEELNSNPEQRGLAFHRYDSTFKHTQQLTLSILKLFGFGTQIMETRIQVEVEKLVMLIRATEVKQFNPEKLIQQSVVNLLMNILFARRFDLSEPKFKKYLEDVDYAMSGMSPECNFFPFLRRLPFYRRKTRRVVECFTAINSFLDEILTDLLQSENIPECFVASYVDSEGQNFDRTELLFILRDLATAGFQTVSDSLLWAMSYIINHPPVQERLHAEIDRVVGNKRLPCLEDRPNLPFVQATVAEVTRIATEGPLAAPHYTLADTEINGYFIPTNSKVLVNLYSVHMDPDIWKDPEVFRPERFLDESGNFVATNNDVIPFSIGKRSCIGEQLARQELFLFVAGILQHFQLLPPDGQTRVSDESPVAFSFLNVPPALHVRFVDRQVESASAL